MQRTVAGLYECKFYFTSPLPLRIVTIIIIFITIKNGGQVK